MMPANRQLWVTGRRRPPASDAATATRDAIRNPVGDAIGDAPRAAPADG